MTTNRTINEQVSRSDEGVGRRPQVQIVSLYYWPETAGSAPPVQQMAEVLAASGCTVRVLTARPFYPERAVFPDYADGKRDQEHHNGVEVQRLPVTPPQSAGMIQRLRTEGLFSVRVWWRLRVMPPADAVIAVCPSILTVLAVILRAKRPTRRLAVVHDIQSGLARSLNLAGSSGLLRVLQRLECLTLNRTDEIITLSNAMETEIRRLNVQTPIRIVPPTVDEDAIRPFPEGDGPFTLLYSGNIGRKQGLDQILDLAGQLREQNIKVRLIIRGEGNYKAELERKALNRNLDKIVAFEPFFSREALCTGMAEGHVHLVPQDPAGAAFAVPSKIYSIMAAGRPFICTAEPESPMDRIRRESDAFVTVPPNRPDALLQAVYRLMEDKEERARLGANGRAYVVDHAGKAACSSDYLAAVLGHADPTPSPSLHPSAPRPVGTARTTEYGS